jgi:hypothetical protein
MVRASSLNAVRDAPMHSGFDAEFVVAAANVLHESVTSDDHAGGVVTFEAVHGDRLDRRAAARIVRRTNDP